MDDSNRKPWLGAALLVGLLYLAISMGSAALANAAASDRTRFAWRLSAFVGSGVVFGAHLGHEHWRRGSRTRSAAWHAAVAVAFGGFGLALAANLHDRGSASRY